MISYYETKAGRLDRNKAHHHEPESEQKNKWIEIMTRNAAGLASLASERPAGRSVGRSVGRSIHPQRPTFSTAAYLHGPQCHTSVHVHAARPQINDP